MTAISPGLRSISDDTRGNRTRHENSSQRDDSQNADR